MKTRNLALTAMIMAIGLVLPPLARMASAGTWLSPMHIPAFLAGLCVGPVAGLVTGVLLPFLNYALYGMPQGATLCAMSVELPVYGLITGLMVRHLKKVIPPLTARIYVSLVTAMILGRIAGGLVHAFIFNVGAYSLAIWFSAYFVATLPGMIVHLILVPAVYIALYKAHLIND